MAGRSRVLGPERVLGPSAFACLVLGVGACFGHNPHPEPAPEATAAGGLGPVGFSGGAVGGAIPRAGGGSILIGATGPGVNPPCVAPAVMGQAVFADQMIDNSKLARREFFSWTTDEQAAELRRDRVLFSRSERPGLGPGYAFQYLQQVAQEVSLSERAQLADDLGQLFAKGRFAWSEPWATRMGWPGEDYGGNLLRIVLKPEAWVVVVRRGDLAVFDLQNVPVPLAEALANPARLGAIFYQKDSFIGGPSCGGSFFSGGSGYREFIVGNLAMIEEWSLGTQQIRDRLSANIEQLSTFLQRIRVCPVTQSAQSWNALVSCQWEGTQGISAGAELFAYEQALSIPSENYLAVPERIAAMIETLRGDLFEIEPLVVAPGSP